MTETLASLREGDTVRVTIEGLVTFDSLSGSVRVSGRVVSDGDKIRDDVTDLEVLSHRDFLTVEELKQLPVNATISTVEGWPPSYLVKQKDGTWSAFPGIKGYSGPQVMRWKLKLVGVPRV